MTFNVVIGNPPYNKDIFLDFVDTGAQISKQYVCMITPAKWQNDADDAIVKSSIGYELFRSKYIKHISDVVFYPYCIDVFDIWQTDGISYYLIDLLNEYETANVTNKCNVQKYFNTKAINRCILHRETLFNIGNELIEYLGNYNKLSIDSIDKSYRYIVWTNQQVAGGGLFSMGDQGSVLGLGASRIIDTYDEDAMQDKTISAKISFSSNNIKECKYFLSYLQSKFLNFFIIINISKLTGSINDDYFRFVPDVGAFDHIYTDEELYKRFKLIDDTGNKKLSSFGVPFINIIESVVRVRK